VAGGPIKVGEIVSGGPPIFFKMGVTLMDLKECQKATNYFKRTIDNTSEVKILIPAWNNKGVCLRRLKKTQEAILCFVKVLSYDPNHGEALYNLKECLQLLGI
jgi:tetratricopeptide (TPR) repeat protein